MSHNLRSYKFPAKVNKYGISNSSLKILVAKYENEFPWNDGLDNQNAIEEFLANHLLKDFITRIQWPFSGNIKKSYFVDVRHVNIESHYAGHFDSEKDEVNQLKTIEAQQGVQGAVLYLTDQINHKKSIAFKMWIDLLTKEYSQDPAFAFLLLRAVCDTSPYGSRRPLPEPEKETISWLYKRLQQGYFNPGHNLSRVYFLKIAFSTDYNIVNGWQFIPSGMKNCKKLSAAAQGSGWCIASGYARVYIPDYSFYILRSNGKPVVALRTCKDAIYECVGVNNSVPIKWAYDILLFTDYMGLNFRNSAEAKLLEGKNLEGKSLDWWKDRIMIWAGAYARIPHEMKSYVAPLKQEDIVPCLYYVSMERIERDFHFNFSQEDCLHIIGQLPNMFSVIMKKKLSTAFESELKEACITAWVERIEDGKLTADEVQELPEFVKESGQYREVIEKCFNELAYKSAIRIARTYNERANPVQLDNLLTYSHYESYDITVRRATSALLNSSSSDFSDSVFPSELIKREDFIALRRDAWKLAINERPSFRLALPHDLAILPEFYFPKCRRTKKDKTKHLLEIETRPWLLDQKGRIPSDIKYGEDALKAYIKGWTIRIEKRPSRLWVTIGSYGSRVYISYAALRNKQIIETYIRCFREALNNNKKIWENMSERTQQIPVILFAFLMAAHSTHNEKMKKKYLGSESLLSTLKGTDQVSEMNRKILKGYSAGQYFVQFKENRFLHDVQFSDFP